VPIDLSPARNVARRSRSDRIGCSAGVIALGLAAIGVVFWVINESAALRQRAMLAAMPTGWTTLIRQRATLPGAVLALEPSRGAAGNGALAVYDTVPGVWTIFEIDSAFARISQGRPEPRDEFIITEVLHDPALDRLAEYAAMRRWEGLDLAVSRSSAAAAHDLLMLRNPDYRHIRAATAALALRGWIRTERGEHAAAWRDLRAAVGIGAMLARHEPTMAGFLAGRAAIHAGATALQHLALIARDPVLADRAAEAAAWSAPSTASDYDVLAAAPDTALALARDTTIALGWRVEALVATIKGPLARPAVRLFGMPRRTARSLEALADGARGEFAQLVRMAVGSVRAIDELGPRGRSRRFAN
jgi:hypothetical protein